MTAWKPGLWGPTAARFSVAITNLVDPATGRPHGVARALFLQAEQSAQLQARQDSRGRGSRHESHDNESHRGAPVPFCASSAAAQPCRPRANPPPSPVSARTKKRFEPKHKSLPPISAVHTAKLESHRARLSTRILGRRTAPFPPFLISHRVPHGSTPRS